jgi:hypothetical protein
MQHRTLTRARVAVAALTLALAGSVAAPPPVQAKTNVYCSLLHVARKTDRHVTKLHSAIWGKFCRRRIPGQHARWWFKPTSHIVGYDIAHRTRHPFLWCDPLGDLDYYVFRVEVTNRHTGYVRHHGTKMQCQHDGHDDDIKGLVQLPRCYMPWVVESLGRGGEFGHRAYCHVVFTMEEVHDGPVPNRHYRVGSGWIIP